MKAHVMTPARRAALRKAPSADDDGASSVYYRTRTVEKGGCASWVCDIESLGGLSSESMEQSPKSEKTADRRKAAKNKKTARKSHSGKKR